MVLDGQKLYSFKQEKEYDNPTEIIDLKQFSKCIKSTTNESDTAFDILSKDEKKENNYYFLASSEAERKNWSKHINAAINGTTVNNNNKKNSRKNTKNSGKSTPKTGPSKSAKKSISNSNNNSKTSKKGKNTTNKGNKKGKKKKAVDDNSINFDASRNISQSVFVGKPNSKIVSKKNTVVGDTLDNDSDEIDEINGNGNNHNNKTKNKNKNSKNGKNKNYRIRTSMDDSDIVTGHHRPKSEGKSKFSFFDNFSFKNSFSKSPNASANQVQQLFFYLSIFLSCINNVCVTVYHKWCGLSCI